VFDWPADGTLRLPNLPHQVVGARLLADAAVRTLQVKQTADGVVIEAPAQPPDPIDSVVVLAVGA